MHTSGLWNTSPAVDAPLALSSCRYHRPGFTAFINVYSRLRLILSESVHLMIWKIGPVRLPLCHRNPTEQPRSSGGFRK